MRVADVSEDPRLASLRPRLDPPRGGAAFSEAAPRLVSHRRRSPNLVAGAARWVNAGGSPGRNSRSPGSRGRRIEMVRLTAIVALAGSLALAACAIPPPPGPSVMVVP